MCQPKYWHYQPTSLSKKPKTYAFLTHGINFYPYQMFLRYVYGAEPLLAHVHHFALILRITRRKIRLS